MKKKLFTILLSLLLSCSILLLASCSFGGGGGTTAGTTTADNAPEAPTDEVKLEKIAAMLDDVFTALNGATFEFTFGLDDRDTDEYSDGRSKVSSSTERVTANGAWVFSENGVRIFVDANEVLDGSYTDSDPYHDEYSVYLYMEDAIMHGCYDDGEKEYICTTLPGLFFGYDDTEGMDEQIKEVGAKVDAAANEVLAYLAANREAVNAVLTDMGAGVTCDDLLATAEVAANLYTGVMKVLGYTSTVQVPENNGSAAKVLGSALEVLVNADGSYTVGISLDLLYDLLLDVLDECKTLLDRTIAQLLDTYLGEGTSTSLNNLLDSVHGTDTLQSLLDALLTQLDMTMEEAYEVVGAVFAELANAGMIEELPPTWLQEKAEEFLPLTVNQLLAMLLDDETVTYEQMVAMLKGYLAMTPNQIYAAFVSTSPENAEGNVESLASMLDEAIEYVKQMKQETVIGVTVSLDSDSNVKSVKLNAKFVDAYSDEWEVSNGVTNVYTWTSTREITLTITPATNPTVAPNPILKAEMDKNPNATPYQPEENADSPSPSPNPEAGMPQAES